MNQDAPIRLFRYWAVLQNVYFANIYAVKILLEALFVKPKCSLVANNTPQGFEFIQEHQEMTVLSRQRLFSAIAIATFLTACSTSRENARATAPGRTTQPVVEANIDSSKSIESVYTTIDLDACERLNFQ